MKTRFKKDSYTVPTSKHVPIKLSFCKSWDLNLVWWKVLGLCVAQIVQFFELWISSQWYDIEVFLWNIWTCVSKKSPTGPTERTPKKPEYLIARSRLTWSGVRWDSVPFNFGWSVVLAPQLPKTPSSNLKLFLHLGVSKNRDTPKWMVYNGKPH